MSGSSSRSTGISVGDAVLDGGSGINGISGVSL